MKATRLIMSSGRQYVISKDIDDLKENYFTNQLGVMINGLVYMNGFAINPSQISSVEYIDKRNPIDTENDILDFLEYCTLNRVLFHA